MNTNFLMGGETAPRPFAKKEIAIVKYQDKKRFDLGGNMFGKFQQSAIRIEVNAPSKLILNSLTKKENIIKWMPQVALNQEFPEQLTEGINFTNYLGLIPVKHKIEIANDHCLRFILSQGIDGYHEWCWGENWLQSRLEGISFLPLNLGQTFSLLSLREYLNFPNKNLYEKS